MLLPFLLLCLSACLVVLGGAFCLAFVDVAFASAMAPASERPERCLEPVLATAVEVLLVAEYVREQLNPADQAHVRSWASSPGPSCRGRPCPLLDRSGGCLAYPVRPLACRATAGPWRRSLPRYPLAAALKIALDLAQPVGRWRNGESLFDKCPTG